MTSSLGIIERMDKLKLVLDLQSIPDGLSLDQFYNIMRNSGIVIWDSTRGGIKPDLIEEKDLTLMDVGFLSEEEFREKFENLMEDEG